MTRSSERFVVEGARAHTWGSDCDVVNASSGGLFLASTSPPPIGQQLTLALALADGPPVTVSGRVIWINDGGRPAARHLPPGFGVRIHRIGLTEKLALLKFLRRQRPAPNQGAFARDALTRGQ